jgi:hypothetical protein
MKCDIPWKEAGTSSAGCHTSFGWSDFQDPIQSILCDFGASGDHSVDHVPGVEGWPIVVCDSQFMRLTIILRYGIMPRIFS